MRSQNYWIGSNRQVQTTVSAVTFWWVKAGATWTPFGLRVPHVWWAGNRGDRSAGSQGSLYQTCFLTNNQPCNDAKREPESSQSALHRNQWLICCRTLCLLYMTELINSHFYWCCPGWGGTLEKAGLCHRHPGQLPGDGQRSASSLTHWCHLGITSIYQGDRLSIQLPPHAQRYGTRTDTQTHTEEVSLFTRCSSSLSAVGCKLRHRRRAATGVTWSTLRSAPSPGSQKKLQFHWQHPQELCEAKSVALYIKKQGPLSVQLNICSVLWLGEPWSHTGGISDVSLLAWSI